jgi:hypothetical protein
MLLFFHLLLLRVEFSLVLSFLLWLLMLVVYSLRWVRCGHSLSTLSLSLSTPQLRSPAKRTRPISCRVVAQLQLGEGCVHATARRGRRNRTTPKITEDDLPSTTATPAHPANAEPRQVKSQTVLSTKRKLGRAVAAAVLSAPRDWLATARRRALGFVGGGYCDLVKATSFHWSARTAVEKRFSDWLPQ